MYVCYERLRNEQVVASGVYDTKRLAHRRLDDQIIIFEGYNYNLQVWCLALTQRGL